MDQLTDVKLNLYRFLRRAWRCLALPRRVWRRLGMGVGARLLALLPVCLVCLFAASRLDLAVAVSLEGELLGYVSSRAALDSIISAVKADAVNSFGCDWEAPALTCRMAVGAVGADSERRVAGALYETIPGVSYMQLVYVDGTPVCGFGTKREAARAVKALEGSYTNETTASACFLEDVSISGGYARADLLSAAPEALHGALSVSTTELLVTEKAQPFEILPIEDPRMYDDEVRILTAGREGVVEAEYLLNRVDGKLTAYFLSESRTLLEPIAETVKVGTRERLSTGSYVWPVGGGTLTSEFGYRVYELGASYHQGIDIGDDYGSPIYAADGGKVIYAEDYGGYGLLIKLEHDNGDVTYYAHNSRMLVEAGDTVEQGKKIAEMGGTGTVTGIHLHFEIRPDGGRPVDPLPYLPEGFLEAQAEPAPPAGPHVRLAAQHTLA